MSRRLLFAALSLLLLGCSAEADVPSSEAAPEQLVLRLQDFEAGWEIGDDSSCGGYGREGLDESAWAIASEATAHCFRQFERPGEAGAWLQTDSEVIVFASEEAARRAFGMVEEFLAYSGHRDLVASDAPIPDLGTERRWLQSAPSTERRWTILAWREGTVVNAVAAAGFADGDALARARDLATIQQARVENPIPTSDADTDDAQAALDRDGLGVPVYWLGATFEAAGLPPVMITRSYGPVGPGNGPGNDVQIEYDELDGRAGVRLWLWEPARWDDFLESELGALSVESSCGEPEVIDLDDRRIEIHELDDPRGEPCAGVVGHVYLDDVVVAINIPICFACGATPGAYASEPGIEAIARGLRPR